MTPIETDGAGRETFKAWLWPDRAIGKRESRILREDYNALYNAFRELEKAQADEVSL